MGNRLETSNASAYFQGRRLIAEGHQTPTAAALGLTEKMLPGANCRCGEVVSLDDSPGCRWHLIRDRWTPGCDAPPIKVIGEVGDLDAMADSYRERHGKDPR